MDLVHVRDFKELRQYICGDQYKTYLHWPWLKMFASDDLLFLKLDQQYFLQGRWRRFRDRNRVLGIGSSHSIILAWREFGQNFGSVLYNSISPYSHSVGMEKLNDQK